MSPFDHKIYEEQRRHDWETFAALLKAGCSIPADLLHIEREYWRYIHETAKPR